MGSCAEDGSVPAAHRDGAWTVSAVSAAAGGSAEEPHLISGGMDGVVRLWRFDAAVTRHPEDGLKAWPGDLVRLGTMRKQHTLAVVSSSTSPDGNLAATTGLDGYLSVWNLRSAERMRKMDANFVEGWATAFSPDSRFLVATSQHGRVLVYSTQNGAKQASYYTTDRDHKADVRMAMAVTYNLDGSVIAVGSSDGAVRLFDVESKKVVLKASSHSNMVRDVLYAPDSPHTMVTASDDHTVYIHDTRARQSVTAKLKDHRGIVTSLAVSPNGCTLASGSGDATVKVWDIAARRCLSTSIKRPDVVWDVAFSTDGKRLISACDSGALYFEKVHVSVS